MNIGNTTPTKIEKQGFPLPPPWIRKTPDNRFLSFIDEIQDRLFGSAKLVRKEPKTTKDKHFIVRTFKAEVRSYRRNYSHRSVALFGTKAGGSTRANIAFMTCSFLELDGSTNSTIKTQSDIHTLIKDFSLPEPSYVIETSRGHFHLIWTYVRPLPFTSKGESYWTSQQKRLIKLFQKSGFNVDVSASLNPTQNLRNPSQLNAYSFKRKCEVFIYKSYKKTSLRRLYKALNGTNIANLKRLRASIKLRRYLRANETFTLTLAELAESIGTSLRTVKTQVSRAVQNGDLQIVARLGNNSEKTRTTQYESLLFIEQIPETKDNFCSRTSPES